MTAPQRRRAADIVVALATGVSALAALTAVALAASAGSGPTVLAATQLFLGATMLGLVTATSSMLFRVPRGLRIAAQLVAGIEMATVIAIAAWIAIAHPAFG